MRFSTVVSLVAIVVVAPVASSHDPPPKPQELGAAIAVFDFCSRVNHDDDRIFDEVGEWLFHGMKREDIERIRHSDAFRQAYSTLQSVLQELPEKDAHAACKAIVPTMLGKFRK